MFTTSGVICIDPNTQKFLILKSKWNARKWSLPKGYIEKGESPLQSALRELYEETSIQLTESDILPQTYTIDLKMDKPTKKIPSGVKRIQFFVSFVKENTPIVLSREHSQWRWVSDFETFEIDHTFESLRENIVKDVFA